VYLRRALGAALLVACAKFDSAPDDGRTDAADAGADDASDAAVACADDCRASEADCKHDTFDACTDWTFGGDTADPGVVGECAGGKLRVAAPGTLDISATSSYTAPPRPYVLHVAVRIRIDVWDGASVISIVTSTSTAAKRIAHLDARSTVSGQYEVTLCGTSCGAQGTSFLTKPGVEHLYVIDISPAETTLSVDCAPPSAKTSGAAFDQKTEVKIELAHGGANPDVDATFDDLVIAFR